MLCAWRWQPDHPPLYMKEPVTTDERPSPKLTSGLNNRGMAFLSVVRVSFILNYKWCILPKGGAMKEEQYFSLTRTVFHHEFCCLTLKRQQPGVAVQRFLSLPSLSGESQGHQKRATSVSAFGHPRGIHWPGNGWRCWRGRRSQRPQLALHATVQSQTPQGRVWYSLTALKPPPPHPPKKSSVEIGYFWYFSLLEM